MLTLRIFRLKYSINGGEMIFYSTNIIVIGDGKYKNAICEMGTYMYLIEYKAKNKDLQRIKGDVTLLDNKNEHKLFTTDTIDLFNNPPFSQTSLVARFENVIVNNSRKIH
jgi:hypothetical protein